MLRIFLAWLLDYSGSTIGRGGDLVEHVSSVPVVCARFRRMVSADYDMVYLVLRDRSCPVFLAAV